MSGYHRVYDASLLSADNEKLAVQVAMSKSDFTAKHGVEPNAVVVPEIHRYGGGLKEILGLSVVYSRDVVRVHVGLIESRA